MSRTGNPYDNAKMESFYKTLKTEEVDLQEYVDLDDAQRHINFFIADLYNRCRCTPACGTFHPPSSPPATLQPRCDLPCGPLDWVHSKTLSWCPLPYTQRVPSS